MTAYYDASRLCIAAKRFKGSYSGNEELTRGQLVPAGTGHKPIDVPLACLPATVIFVHGVNSEGEWYAEAESGLCKGLNQRLKRTDIAHNVYEPKDKTGRQDLKTYGNSPVIHFFWGYKSPPLDIAKYNIDLRPGNYWGGGPFQNGTTSLMELWGDGVQDLLMFIDPQRVNPIPGRRVHEAPPRWYMVHAAQRLAFLMDEIRKANPMEAINVLCHSQGNMIGMLAQLFTRNRPADTLLLHQPPYALGVPKTVLATNDFDLGSVQTEAARRKTLANLTRKLVSAHASSLSDKQAFTDEKLWGGLRGLLSGWSSKPAHERDNRGKVFLNFNVHDRVIGVSAIEGIGWQGVDDAFLRQVPTGSFYQRAYAGGEIVGSAPHAFNFVSTKVAGAFWYPKPERVRFNLSKGETLAVAMTSIGSTVLAYSAYADGLVDIYNDPDPRSVTINAPAVPVPIALQKRGSGKLPKDDFDQGAEKLGHAMGDDLHYAAKDETRKKVLVRYDTVRKPVFDQADNMRWVDERVPVYRDESDAERLARVGLKPVSQTDHGGILGHPSYRQIVSNVTAYDLSISPNIVQKDANYWQYLHNLADWKISDPYFHGQCMLTRASLPPLPPEIDKDTYQVKVTRFFNEVYDIGTLPARLPRMAADAAVEQGKRLGNVVSEEVQKGYEAGKSAVNEAGSEMIRRMTPHGLPPTF